MIKSEGQRYLEKSEQHCSPKPGAKFRSHQGQNGSLQSSRAWAMAGSPFYTTDGRLRMVGLAFENCLAWEEPGSKLWNLWGFGG
jgi:hypothetical protein